MPIEARLLTYYRQAHIQAWGKGVQRLVRSPSAGLSVFQEAAACCWCAVLVSVD